MNISLTPVLEDMVKAKVASGYYNNASEVIREALRLMDSNERLLEQAKLACLQKHLGEGMEELRQGRGTSLQSPQDIARLFATVKAGGDG